MTRRGSSRRRDDRGVKGYRDDRDRDHRRDNFRSPPPPRFPSPPRSSRNYGGSDSWRPNGERRDGAAQAQAQARSYNDERRDGDSYRPSVPQGDFTFRVEKPAGMADSYGGHQLSERERERERERRPRRQPRSGALGARPGRGRWQPPPHPSERALISGITAQQPEEHLYNSEGAKFRDLDELSDDDELDMDISSQSESEEPSAKRIRTASTQSDSAANSAPKWSNPDPYTALPCPDESTKKKRDVVKLIRKARLEDTSDQPAASTTAANFLAFDSEDEEDEHNNNSNDDVNINNNNSSEHNNNEGEKHGDIAFKAPRSPASAHNVHSALHTTRPNSLPNKPVATSVATPDNSGHLGSRKRTIDDEIKPPDYQLKKATMKAGKGYVVPEWDVKKGEEACPWATIDHSATNNMAFRLHKEIMDFYEYVKPQKFEQAVRDSLVENLKKAMKRDNRSFASAKVFAFGSFKSGLYLPTADMDLVVCSASFLKDGPATYLSAKNWLYKFQKFLTAQHVAEPNTIVVIAHARIPLVKYVDKATGLKVDVSFENLGGVNAIETFLRWKEQYPAMPVLVTVIKHYLLMRGLNEPVNGGIGGFSVICLVVSMLQLMPQVQSRSLIPEHHLGEMLLEFFDLYGRRFNYTKNAISLTEPVGYIEKNYVTSFVYKNTGRLSIIDPNNSANDISGGSSNTSAILDRFAGAFYMLCDRMREVAKDSSKGGILDIIMMGDYSSFRRQRNFLKHVHEKTIGPCPE